VTMTRPAIVRLTVGVPLALAVLFSVPTQRVVAGKNLARAGIIGSLGVNVSLHRMSNGKIAFVGGFADGSLDVINPDGSGLRRLVRCKTRGCMIIDAVWSPDGRRIAFLRGMPTRGGDVPLSDLSLYVKNANGSGERWLARCGRPVGCYGGSLAWSPDGTSIVILRSRSLYVFDLHSGRLRRLTAPLKCGPACTPGCPQSLCAPTDLAPAWSPDGSRIAFARALHGCAGGCPTEPYIVNADGTGLKRLSSLSGAEPLLWSPDGRTIAFSAVNGIYAVNPNGSHLRLLVHAPPVGANQVQIPASWSPDGRHILYIRTPSSGPGGPQATALWVMNASGTGHRRLFRAGHGSMYVATWSPDGRLIAFSVTVDRGDGQAVNVSRSGVFVMGADGRHLHRLIVASYELAWQPFP
jgi:Tol biopolymer transport system component